MKPPTKWHLARVGLLTGAVGLGAGWMLFSSPPSPVVRVVGARQLSVACQGYQARVDGPIAPLAGKGPCTIEASFDAGSSATGRWPVTLSASCTRDGDELECASWSP